MIGTNPYGILNKRPKGARRVELWTFERRDGWACHVPELPAASVSGFPTQDDAKRQAQHFVGSIVSNLRNQKKEVEWQPLPKAPRHVTVHRIRVATLTVKDLV